MPVTQPLHPARLINVGGKGWRWYVLRVRDEGQDVTQAQASDDVHG